MSKAGLKFGIVSMAIAFVFSGMLPVAAQNDAAGGGMPPTAAPAPSAPTTFQSVFGSSQTPVSLKWGDVQSGWFKFTASEQTEGGVYAQLYGNLLGVNVYYTQGTTIAVGSETYLVAYRPQSKSLDIAGLMNSYTKPPKPAPLTPETPLSLCLLNVRTMGSLKDITPLNPQRESQAVDDVRQDAQQYYADEERARGSLVSETNLKRLGEALLAYAQHRNETLPPMKNAVQAKAALFKFAKSNSLFTNPKTHQLYQPNPALSGHRLAAIRDRRQTIVYYEPFPMDGLRGVLYLDGHTRRLADADWRRVKRASKIP